MDPFMTPLGSNRVRCKYDNLLDRPLHEQALPDVISDVLEEGAVPPTIKHDAGAALLGAARDVILNPVAQHELLVARKLVQLRDQ